MPLTHFDCEAGNIPIKECLKSCPLGDRCLSLATLHDVGKNRDYHDKFSTTLLINPTRIAYLLLTTNYSINPKERAFALLGTRHHKRLEVVGQRLKELKVELPVLDFETTSTIDNLEPDNAAPGFWLLIDYKTWGCYSVMKALGVDKQGNKVKPDYSHADLQLNDYRIKAESLGFPISHMRIQYTARDGNTELSRRYGLDKPMGLIEIPRYEDIEITEYFQGKNEALRYAIENKEMPPICSAEDRWGDKRCRLYCDVRVNCEHGQLYLRD